MSGLGLILAVGGSVDADVCACVVLVYEGRFGALFTLPQLPDCIRDEEEDEEGTAESSITGTGVLFLFVGVPAPNATVPTSLFLLFSFSFCFSLRARRADCIFCIAESSSLAV